ncbi:MAG: DUF11 domain-containing protein [Anaerolineae bacterium]|nr:DUF11 domain-containing protein [Anaerolineae bacterium]
MRRLTSFVLVLALLLSLVPLPGAAATTVRDQVRAPMAPEGACPGDLIISEYVEGTSNNKAVEIFNGTGAPVSLDGYRLTLYVNGTATPGNSYDFSGTLLDGDAFVIANPSAVVAVTAVAEATDDVTYFNGNDALVLTYNGVIIDSIGDVDSANYWGAEMTLVRRPSIIAGDTITNDTFVVDTEWIAYPQNTFDYLGSHSIANCGPGLWITKSAPGSVSVDEVFTYTVVVENALTLDLAGLSITDTLPLSLTAQTISDGGVVLPGNMVSWTVASLAQGVSVTRTVSVKAPAVNVQLSNDDYAVQAANWATPTMGIPVNTTVSGQLVSIGDARGMSGQTVTVAGRATMYTGGFYASTGKAKAYIQDATGGVSLYGALPEITLGDWVTVTGAVSVYNGEIEILPINLVVVDGTSADVPGPMDVALADFDSPDTLGWLTRVQGQVVSIQSFSYNYAIDISDGTDTVEIYVDKQTGIDIGGIALYDDYQVTGIAELYNTTYELKPRIQEDFVKITLPTLRVRKSAPAYVVTGSRYAYTLVATNNTTETLHNVVVTDTLPANVTLAGIGDGGVQVGNVISWTAASLASGEALTVSFDVTATAAAGSTVVNDDYGALADEWLLLAAGPAIETQVTAGCGTGNTSIYDIQGSGAASSMDGDPVTVCAVVIGVAPGLKGFFLQDVAGDGDADTADGIFVYRENQSYNVTVGNLVKVSGVVDEYYNATQISAKTASDVLTILASDSELPQAITLDPPATRAAADLYLEPLEGMLVEVPVTVTVVGPTNGYGDYYVVRGETGLARILRDDMAAFDGYRLGVDDGIVASDDYVVGDVLIGVAGPLHFTYSNWMVEQLSQPDVISLVDVPESLPQYPQPGMYDVTMGAFNTLNFDGLDTEVKLNKVVSNIVALGGPAVLSLEEIAAMDTWDSAGGYTITAVLNDLVTALAAQGYTYASAYTHPDVGGHGVAVLYNPDVFVLNDMADLQGCSSVGSSSSTYDPIWDTCRAINQYPLFSRRPVVLTGTFGLADPPVQVTFIGAHLKSGIGVAADEQRRLEQAQLIAAFSANLQADGQENVIVAGDLNDFMDSAPLQALQTTGMLTDTFYTLPPDARYSYIYNGVSQVLDHLMVSEALFEKMTFFTPLHTDSDYPAGWESDPTEAYGVSDHDPVQATFTLWTPANLTLTKSVVPTTAVFPGDLVTYTLVLSNSSAVSATGVILTDVLPWEVNFMDWIEHPGGASVTDDVLTWSGEIAGGEMLEVSFVVSVRADSFFYAHPVVNTATFTADNAESGQAGATFEIGGEVSLEFEKSVVAIEPTPGTVVTYALTLHNPSEGLAGAIVINDPLPAALDFNGWVQQSDAVQVNDVIGWSGDLAAGSTLSIIFTAMIREDALYETVTNTATYVAAGTLTGSDSAAFTVVPEPVLRVGKSVSPDRNVALGGVVTYTIQVYNPTDDTPNTGILITDVLPAELDFGGWVWSSGATQADDVVTWSGNLAPGGLFNIVFTATLHDDEALYGQTITNTVRFIADGDVSGQGAAPLTVVEESSALSVVKTVSPGADVPLGGVVTYTITLNNAVATPAGGVVLTDVLPSAVAFGGWVGAEPSGAVQVGNAITWTGAVLQGSPLTLAFTATLDTDPGLAGQTIVNTAAFTSASSGSGSDVAGFTIAGGGGGDFFIFLPLVMRQEP